MKIKRFRAFFPSGKKLLMNIMRVFILLFFGTVFSFNTIEGLAQNIKVNFDAEAYLTVDDVFETIEKQTHFNFIYRSDMFSDLPKIHVKKGKISIKKLLEDDTLSIPFDFVVEDENIVVRESSRFTSTFNQQQKDITGTVTDEAGVPIPGVNITVEGTSRGTSTDFDGNYSIEAEEGEVLNFSSIGFEDQSITIGSDLKVDIVMKEGASLDEVVVVGYGTQKARDVSTAISSVKAESFNKGVISDPIEQIQGKVAGLVVIQPSGDPNENKTIRLRGQASLTGGQDPLIVLDGVPLDDAEIISNIPAEDIESFDVLKDASATAVYGSRGANGVIMMNTKKGRSGKTIMTYSGKIGVSQLAKSYDLLNTREWEEASRSMGASDNTIDGLKSSGGNTDWMKAITRTAMSTSHHFGLSGGTENFNYYGSVSYLEQEGIVLNTNKEQVGIHFNAEQKAFDDKLSIRIGILNTDTKKDYVDGEIFGTLVNNLPGETVYNEDGSYNEFADNGIYNIVQHQKEQLNSGKENYLVLHGGIDYALDGLLDGLSAGVSGSISKFDRDSLWFQPTYILEGNFNNARQSTQHRNSKKGDIHINYNKDFGENHFDATLVHEYSDFTYDIFSASGQQYMVEDNEAYSLENGNPQYNSINSYKERYDLSSFLARVSYNFAHKYYLNASYRRDGSSKFGKNNRWGSFPAFSLAWRMNEEGFLKSIDWIDELKLRGGYGVTGNQDAIDAYRTERLMGNLGRFYDGRTDSYPIAYGPKQNDNPDLKWEEVHGTNIGLDFTLLDHRIDGNLNWFHNKTKNLLFTYTVPVPPFYVDNILANVGSLVNKGFEAQLNGTIVETENFKWLLNTQITFFDTKISSLSGEFSGFDVLTDDVRAGIAMGRGMTGDAITYLKKGSGPFTFLLPRFSRVDEEGNQLFYDGNGGEVKQGDLKRDMYAYKDPSMDFSYGLGSTFIYKNWSLDIFMRGVSGQKNFNNTRLITDNLGRLPGLNTTRNGIQKGIKDSPIPSDLWLEDASFLRLDNITLGYDFNSIPGIKNLRLSATANNLFILTSYNGLDPEIRIADTQQAYIDASVALGDGRGYYPKDRSFSISVNLTF